MKYGHIGRAGQCINQSFGQTNNRVDFWIRSDHEEGITMGCRLRSVCVWVLAGTIAFGTIGVRGGAHAFRDDAPGSAVVNGLGTPVQLIWSVVAGVVAFFLKDPKETGENQFMRYFDYVYNREIAANGSRLEVGDRNIL
jgi:hypothetical protein